MSGYELYLLIALVAVIGFVLGWLSNNVKKVGTFTINYSDPEKDLCELRLDKDLPEIDKLHRIALDVKVIKTKS